MEEKKIPTESLPDSYRTGEVQPPKSHRGIISLLLLLVIFVGSLISVLGFWGIHLFQLLWGGGDVTAPLRVDMRLSQEDSSVDHTPVTGLGVEGRFLSRFDQHYFGLPQGIYITQVRRSACGIRTGDVLTRINQTPIPDLAALQVLLKDQPAGSALTLEVYRDGAVQTLTAILE